MIWFGIWGVVDILGGGGGGRFLVILRVLGIKNVGGIGGGGGGGKGGIDGLEFNYFFVSNRKYIKGIFYKNNLFYKLML